MKARAHRAESAAPSADGFRHLVHFYESDDAVVETLAEFVASGLGVGAPVLGIVTDEHVARVRQLLEHGFIDVRRAIESGRLTFLSAEATLAASCENGDPDWSRFEATIGDRLRSIRARNGARTVRVFGEMVNLLCASGKARGAVRLEEMWNELARTECFTLLCAYDVKSFADGATPVGRVFDLHTRTRCDDSIAVEDPAASAQRARSLEASIRRRSLVERELREQSRINENLIRIASVLTSELDHDRLVQKVTDEARSLCRAQVGAFFHNVVVDNGESYTLYTLSGAPREAFAKFPLPRKTGVFQPTFEGTGTLRSDDITKDPRYGKNDPHCGMPEGHLPIRSYLAVPVKARSGEVLGGLFFGHEEPGIFTATDEELLQSVAASAAVAMDNARLFQAVRRAEASADAEREKLRQLFRQSPAMIVILRGRDHVYEFVNEEARTFVGRDDAVGRPFREVLPEMPSGSPARLDEVFETGRRWVLEAVPLVRDWNDSGQPFERFFNMFWEPYRRGDGAIQGVMAFAFEVTDQVLSARKLEAIAKELEVASRTKDEFLATVSHELRTPLNAILGWVRMLRTGSLPPDKRERALETIERNANAQTQLIEDLLDVSRIISGKLRLKIGTVDMHTVIENAVDALRPAAQAKGVKLVHAIDPTVQPISGDADRLQQVVWNLLTNGVKFTPKGGTVHVELLERDAALELVVRDDGQGIEPEFLPRVFERFRQADATTSRKHGGLGLGLAIVRHLIELHGGSATVDSDGDGKGATFTVTLPIGSLRSPTVSPPALRADRPSDAIHSQREIVGAHILVVDDEPDARELLAEMLTTCGAKVSTAGSVAEAIGLVQELRPDVVVSDIGMPGEDGYDLIKQLRALAPDDGGKTPAVALTAYARLEDRTKALVAGFNMHVPKPVEPAELLGVLTSLMTIFSR